LKRLTIFEKQKHPGRASSKSLADQGARALRYEQENKFLTQWQMKIGQRQRLRIWMQRWVMRLLFRQ
jgi:hypothetical protein